MNNLLNNGVVSILNFRSMKMLLKLCERIFSFLELDDEILMGDVSPSASGFQMACVYIKTWEKY